MTSRAVVGLVVMASSCWLSWPARRRSRSRPARCGRRDGRRAGRARATPRMPELAAVRAEVDAAVGRLRPGWPAPEPHARPRRPAERDQPGQQRLGRPDVPLDLNGRKEGRVGVADRELAMKRAQLADRERRLRAEVRMKAGESLAAARNVQVTDELLHVNRDGRCASSRSERGRGAIPPLEENLMQVEVNRLDASRQRAREPASRCCALQLKALVGLAPEDAADAPGRAGGAGRSDGPRRLARPGALASRPDLDAARTDVALARARIRKEEADGRWDASVNVGYQRQEIGFELNGLTDRGGTRPIQDVFHCFGGGVTITLPVRNRNQGNVQAARAEVRGGRAAPGVRSSSSVRQEVAAAFTQHDVARRSLALYARGVRDLARPEPRRRPAEPRARADPAARRDRRAAAVHRDRDGVHGRAEASLDGARSRSSARSASRFGEEGQRMAGVPGRRSARRALGCAPCAAVRLGIACSRSAPRRAARLRPRWSPPRRPRRAPAAAGGRPAAGPTPADVEVLLSARGRRPGRAQDRDRRQRPMRARPSRCRARSCRTPTARSRSRPIAGGIVTQVHVELGASVPRGAPAGHGLQLRAGRRADDVPVHARHAGGGPQEARAHAAAGRDRGREPPGAGGGHGDPRRPRHGSGVGPPAAAPPRA